MGGRRWARVASRPGGAAAAENEGWVGQGWGGVCRVVQRTSADCPLHSVATLVACFLGTPQFLANVHPPTPTPLPWLYPGIEKYGESWQQVAEHVGGRSAMQCVARFLQLPTEEALAADATPGPASHGLVRKGRARQGGRGAGAWVCSAGLVAVLGC